MSEYIKSLGELNAEEFLQDFISTYLILNQKEQEIWDYLCNQKTDNQYFYSKSTRGNIARSQYRTCTRCGEIKDIEEFASRSSRVCNECKEKRVKSIILRQKTRFCKECQQIKPIEAFNGRDYICKQCKERW